MEFWTNNAGKFYLVLKIFKKYQVKSGPKPAFNHQID